MEVKMATVIHHHVSAPDVPAGVYWTAGIVIAALMGLLFYFSTSSSSTTELAMPILLPPITPFIPLM
jgi:hypothetical protein